ncbi:MAG: cysteine methyltransferase [Gammaproteobacteria bacterium]|nr:cysteine methyltransferase [Gammaproteobacteria bacterium]
MDTEFEDAVRILLIQVPRGTVTSYSQLAKLAGYPGYARHVGRLLSQLPDDSKLPWHRVVTASREISRRGTLAAAIQKQLLRAEGVALKGDRVDPALLWVPDWKPSGR